METAEYPHLQTAIDHVRSWRRRSLALTNQQQRVEGDAHDAAQTLRDRLAAQAVGGGVAWRTLALSDSDLRLLTALARRQTAPAWSPTVRQGVHQLAGGAQQALHDVKALGGLRRRFASAQRREQGRQAASYLVNLHHWLGHPEVEAELTRVETWHAGSTPTVPLESALDGGVGLRKLVGAAAELLPQIRLAGPLAALDEIDRALRRETEVRRAAKAAGDVVRQADARRLISEMPVDRLKETTKGQLRLGALTTAGITTVQQVLDQGPRILTLPGVGDTTGNRMLGAARTLWQTVLDDLPVRLDLKNRSREATALLRALQDWDRVRSIRGASDDLETVSTVRPLLRGLPRETRQLIVVPETRSVPQLRAALATVERLAAGGERSAGPAKDPWDDFLARPADFYALLAELGFLVEDEAKVQGDLPAEIVDAIRRLKLDTSQLKASLRGYQSFAARFALVQRKVIIGDEMGLGKTVEALAVMAHLRAKGDHHHLVVCPAAVVTNWVREIQAKSKLRAHRLHGPGRDQALASWSRHGGVAVTTYDTLGWLEGRLPSGFTVACLTFDEAHYIKNPDAQRSRRSAGLIRQASRTILLTGTPLENRIDEFRNLVGYLRPDLSVTATEFAPRQFRKQVAPAYLRRNQEDVLTELPPLVEVTEWLPLSAQDRCHYRTAVLAGNFMQMRQAALRGGAESEKLRRLIEIVQEAEDNGRKVLVFSYFKDVLDIVSAAMPGRVIGPLHGGVPPAKRQQMVDDFSTAQRGAVLVAQIVAGGVGLNVQAASVVVICEPQLKPTMEWQAIARAHRMGQLDSVQVHRLLSEEGVDQRITEILARKKELFEDFARESETAGSAPEALDITDAEVAREVVAAERERLLGTDTY
ncbi:DEAD/DEAH box helicase [Nocardioides marmoribigeumensis]|uniref:Superfamily II DNA or RNA helicase n=1 Tax=Nocardioides marmoribigeumensis TaxID=433649 RepID=A0ABU2BY77_9ACTN|nr:DEAD/DEAH box helicase [Nocardioides marmoribigeumensis]MDR7363361.1 superfamily II DNA or RNA helicase [Nocardioides marmoribigeumensis]